MQLSNSGSAWTISSRHPGSPGRQLSWLPGHAEGHLAILHCLANDAVQGPSTIDSVGRVDHFADIIRIIKWQRDPRFGQWRRQLLLMVGYLSSQISPKAVSFLLGFLDVCQRSVYLLAPTRCGRLTIMAVAPQLRVYPSTTRTSVNCVPCGRYTTGLSESLRVGAVNQTPASGKPVRPSTVRRR